MSSRKAKGRRIGTEFFIQLNNVLVY
jgi:hypothetical protein